MSAELLEWDCAGRPLPGQPVSGDRAGVVVAPPRALAVAVDGLGHGAEAAEAAEAAIEAARTGPVTDVTAVVRHCHRALAGTRGAALAIASLDADAGTMTWAGVGNVEGRLVRATFAGANGTESLMMAAGIVGHAMPRLRPATLSVRRGDLVLLATDGVAAGFADDLTPSGSCRAIAERLLARHARTTDDAVVLVVRYLGATG